MYRFVDGRAVNPDHLAIVVLDLGALAGLVMLMVWTMRREVAMGDSALMFMTRTGLMDVSGRQC